MNPVEKYLRDLHEIRASGSAVKETSYYGALSNLLNDVGKTLKPRVRCIINIQNRGAGIPDGGLFTSEQFQRTEGKEPQPGTLPARGVIEIKGTGEDAWVVADGQQVSKYWGKYRQVLVTNYRDFVLVGQDANGQPTKMETYRLAPNEAAFWAGTKDAHGMAHEQSAFLEYLQRVMLHAAPLASPADVAWFLASYAREARHRVEKAAKAGLPALAAVRQALEQALGLTFEGEKGDHFFQSTLIQTLFYGVFSAWVLWSKSIPRDDNNAHFNWRMAEWELHVPMIRALFEQLAMPSKLRPLGLEEVLDWTGNALNRVDRVSFFEKFEEENAVQYFYEPFLESYDPELRKQLGVWYTPQEIVQYMVARTDAVLREELGIADGLADERVVVLDPCCGTGAFCVETLRHIAATLKAQGEEALLGAAIKRAAKERVFGFEILPAPFVVAHLQMGLLLQNLGAPLADDKDERAAIYLTNALTGWEPAKEPKTHLLFPELEDERDHAQRVKQNTPILVIIGNPPYNGFAGIAVEEERDLSNAYRTTKLAPKPQGQGLNDLYVRFFRVAERRIAGDKGRGVVCFISNYSWLDGLSFTGMREHYLQAFSSIWIDNLHGDRIVGEVAPDGKSSETIFAVRGTSSGIKVGTAISMLVANRQEDAESPEKAHLRYRDFHQSNAAERRKALLASATDPCNTAHYTTLEPKLKLGLPFKPRAVGASYLDWPILPELFPVSFPGVKTSRDSVVVDISREGLETRMGQYFNSDLTDEQVGQSMPDAMRKGARFDAPAVRKHLLKRGFLSNQIVRHCYRPFDVRWLYWEPETKLLDEKREDYFPQVFEENVWLVTQQKPRREWSPPQFIRPMGCLDLMDRGASCFPLLIRPQGQMTLGDEPDLTPRYNLSDRARTHLEAIDALDMPETLFYHALAVLHAPVYREENAGSLRQDWPRIPLPPSREMLETSSALGRQVAALLDTETPVVGVTAGAIRAELRPIAVISRVGGGSLDPEAGDLALTAGWGHGGSGGVTMPAKGRLERRDYTAQEQSTLRGNVSENVMPTAPALGDTTCDIFLNQTAYWRNIPKRVWDYTLGGYQVLKKWLSYREIELLGRALTEEEAREFTQMARRIAALLLLEAELDANYALLQTAPSPVSNNSPSDHDHHA